mgnify:CR=1 FL=1
MKLFLLLIIATTLIFSGCTQEKEDTAPAQNIEKKLEYDSSLAAKYGADDYGMKKYVMAFLKHGPNRDLYSAEAFRLQKAHLQNITSMAEDGKLVLAGPFLDRGDVRGIYIFNVETIEEAEKMTNTDPAIKAGSLEMELRSCCKSTAP